VEFFGGEVGEGFLEGCFLEVGAFVGPAEEIGYLYLALLVYEYVVGTDIPYF
jgi:hypothetical protein